MLGHSGYSYKWATYSLGSNCRVVKRCSSCKVFLRIRHVRSQLKQYITKIPNIVMKHTFHSSKPRKKTVENYSST